MPLLNDFGYGLLSNGSHGLLQLTCRESAVDLIVFDDGEPGLQKAHLHRLNSGKLANAITVFGPGHHPHHLLLHSVVLLSTSATCMMRQLTVDLAVMEDLARLEVLLPIAEQGHGGSCIDDLNHDEKDEVGTDYQSFTYR